MMADGLYRIRFDKNRYERLTDNVEAMKLTKEQLSLTERQVLQEIRRGWLATSEKEQRLNGIREDLLFDIKFANQNQAATQARSVIPVRAETEVIEELLRADTPEKIKEICSDAFTTRRVEVEPGVEIDIPVPNWPISSESVLPRHLAQHAKEFIDAKNDRRFPRSSRPTNRLKQLWFLARALAGAVLGIKTRTAINLVGSMRPEEMFHRTREGKSKRKVAHRQKATRSSP